MLQSQAYINPAFCQKSEYVATVPNENNNTICADDFKVSDDLQEELVLDGRFSPQRSLKSPVIYAAAAEHAGPVISSPVSGCIVSNPQVTQSNNYQALKPVLFHNDDDDDDDDDDHNDDGANQQNRKYEAPSLQKYSNGHRYEYIDQKFDEPKNEPIVEKLTININPKRLSNPEATRKLYEILNTPPIRKKPKIVQRLEFDQNNAMGTKNAQTPDSSLSLSKTTAVITPMRPKIVFKDESESPQANSIKRAPVTPSMTIASILMIFCSILTSALSMYMISVAGRFYYLDFALMSGFACLLLGILGFKTRKSTLSPHRNYVSGYVILCTFSLITCTGLLVLLVKQPKPGSALADITSGAVCGISGLSIILATAGSLISYCCQFPPLDTRVQCSFSD